MMPCFGLTVPVGTPIVLPGAIKNVNLEALFNRFMGLLNIR